MQPVGCNRLIAAAPSTGLVLMGRVTEPTVP